MKMKLVTVGVLSVMMTAPYALTLNTDMEKLSYSIGVDLGKNIKQKQIDINVPAMAQGIEDAMSDKGLLLTDEQMKDSLMKFQKDMMAKSTAQFEQKAKDNQVKGKAFLHDNQSKPGVVSLPSGLQYKIITSANGPKPTKSDTVTVEYSGRLIDGQVFDSTEKAGKPATFQLMQVIPGWTEALQLMPVGSTWELYVPSNLAYGVRNVGGLIGPNETLIFSVHLLSIDKDNKTNK